MDQWVWGGWVGVYYSAGVRYTITIWSRKNRDESSGGLTCAKKPKDLSASERQDRGHGKGVGVYVTLLQSHTLCKALNY